MTAPFQSLKEYFLATLEIAPELRAEWLDRLCAEDPGLREQLRRMLAAHDHPDSLLDHPLAAVPLSELPGDPGRTLYETTFDAIGAIIGPYKLLQQIGEGGLGAVFMAEQTHPVRRRVAIKVIKPGMVNTQGHP